MSNDDWPDFPLDLRRQGLQDLLELAKAMQMVVNALLGAQMDCRETPGCPIAARCGTRSGGAQVVSLRLLERGQPPGG